MKKHPNKPIAFTRHIENVCLVTSNSHKVEEYAGILGCVLPCQAIECDEIQDVSVANVARRKAHEAYKALGRPLIVDDSGLYVKAWGGFPGSFIKHLLHAGGVSLLQKMTATLDDRKAQAICAIAYHDGHEIHVFEGVVDGTLSRDLQGESSFGYDSLFIPAGQTLTFAQLGQTEKNKLSHRYQAISKLRDYFNQ